MGENYTPQQKKELGQKAMHEMLQKIFSESMKAKRAFMKNQVREDPISNFATTAPRSEFIVNADISSDLADGIVSSNIFVSTDGQASWNSGEAVFLGTEGYESTWASTILTSGGSSAYAYLAGVVDSEALGFDYGTILVSGSPHNVNGYWPPSSNLYGLMATDETGETSSSYDITSIYGTYKGNVDNDIERFYLKMDLNGGCCDEGGLFGPWFLYGVGLVNPSTEEADGNSGTAYAIGYGDGGFGQLTPGLLKISGDLATGEIDGFEYLTTNISYNQSGNSLQMSAAMSNITNDSGWGTWPNSYNGFIVLGVTVEASLDGFDVAANILDQTNPGLMVCNTTYQDGNIPLVLSNPNFNSDNNSVSVSYTDNDGNLPWKKSVHLCNAGTDDCPYEIEMIPDGHDYETGVTFQASIGSNVSDGDYDAKFWFADDDIENYPNAQLSIPITIGSGSACGDTGDLNLDSVINVLDVVLLVNQVLGTSEAGDCSDINGDSTLNVLDVVILVNMVLDGLNSDIADMNQDGIINVLDIVILVGIVLGN